MLCFIFHSFIHLSGGIFQNPSCTCLTYRVHQRQDALAVESQMQTTSTLVHRVCLRGGWIYFKDNALSCFSLSLIIFLSSFNTLIAIGMMGHILMFDTLPHIAKVFNLVVKEERQCTIRLVSLAMSESLAFSTYLLSPSVATSSSQGKPKCDHPICSHSKLTGHIVDRCYKLHGYPLGYKSTFHTLLFCFKHL